MVSGIPQELIGTIPGWITSAGMVTIVVTLLKNRVRFKELDDKRDLATHEREDKRDVDIRVHYAEELERVISRQRECEKREEELRRRVNELENDILGLLSIIRQASADKVILLDERASDSIQQMAQRILEGRKL